MKRNGRSLVLAVLASAVVVAGVAPQAEAARIKCARDAVGISCFVDYKATPKLQSSFTFSINHDSNLVKVEKEPFARVWLDGTKSSSTPPSWHVGPLWKPQSRFRFTLWRACARAYPPDRKFVCTGWAWQGPPDRD